MNKKKKARSDMGAGGVTVAASIALTTTSLAVVSLTLFVFAREARLVTIKQTDRPHLYSQVS